MIDPHAYSIEIRRGNYEGEVCFQARVLELPDLYEYADSYDEAYGLVIESISMTAEALAEQGKQMPAPFEHVEEFSGRVTLRLPRSLHASLARRADCEDVSLNALLVSILSAYRGFDLGMQNSHDEWQRLVQPMPSPIQVDGVSMDRHDLPKLSIVGWNVAEAA